MPLLVVALVEFVRGALILSLLPQYALLYAGYPISTVGTAIFLHYLFDNVFRIPAGWLVDHRGGKGLMLAGTAFSTAGVLLICCNHGEASFLLGAGLFGLGVAPLWPTVISEVVRRSTMVRLGESLSWVFISWLVGTGMGAVGINFILSRSIKAAFLFLAGILLITIFTLISSRLSPPVQGNHQRFGCYLKELLLKIGSLWFLYPGMFIQTMSLGILLPVIAIFARECFNLSADQFSYTLIGGGAFTVVLLIPAGKLVDRIGEKRMLTTGFLAAALCLMVLPGQKFLLNAIVVGAFLGVSYSMILPAWNSLQARLAAPEKLGTMWAVFMAVEGLGIGMGSLVGGVLWEGLGFQAPFLISSVMLFVMAVFYVVVDLEKLGGTGRERGKGKI